MALRAVPWWNLRAYLNVAVIVSAIAALFFAGFWWSGVAADPIPWWWVAIAVLFAAYWPIERAFVQARARRLFPIVLRPSTGEIGIDGERFAMKSVDAIECVRVRYGDGGGEFGPIEYHEIYAVVSMGTGLRRIEIVDEGMNSQKIAAELARMIGCSVRTVDVAGPYA